MNFNPHPVLASFPLAFIVLGFLLELCDLLRRDKIFGFVVRVMVVIATLGVAAAFYSGYFAIEGAEGGSFAVPNDEVAFHHNFGRILLFMVVPLLILNFAKDKAVTSRQVWNGLYYIFFATCALISIYVGYLGGELIFKHGVGVHVMPNSPPIAANSN